MDTTKMGCVTFGENVCTTTELDVKSTVGARAVLHSPDRLKPRSYTMCDTNKFHCFTRFRMLNVFQPRHDVLF